MASNQEQDKLNMLQQLGMAEKGKKRSSAPKPQSHRKDMGATATKEQRATRADETKDKEIPASRLESRHSSHPNRATRDIELKALKRFLNDDDGVKVFRKNPQEYLNGDRTVKAFPDLLDQIPALPDLAPVIHKYFASGDNSLNSFDNQLQGMMDGIDPENRHDFSLMLTNYIRTAIDTITSAGNSRIYKNYPSLVDFKEHYGDGKINRSSMMFAILGGQFKPDVALQKRFLGAILGKHRKDSQTILKDLLRYRTLTPNNYQWSDHDTTTFNFPSNFGAVITISVIKYLMNGSDFFTSSSLQGLIEQDAHRSSRSKSLSRNTIYQNLQKYLNLRLVINTKLQHVLFDGLTAHTNDDVKR